MRVVRIVPLLDELPSAIVRRPGRVWNVFARSLGEQGADDRTALAWRWALTGACPSPITLSASPARPPGREELLAEAHAPAELGSPGGDPGGQVMHARFVLQWLVGEIDALPLWNGGPSDPHITDGADYSRSREEIEKTYDWAHLARTRFPWPGESTLAAAWRDFGWAFGVMQLLGWVCGELPEGPTSGLRISGGPPTLYEVSLDSRRAMTALLHARQDNQPTLAGRMEAIMETFLWLAGWNPTAPVDRHGHIAFDDCSPQQRPMRLQRY